MLSKKLIPMPDCAVCLQYGGLMCERCGETYCSRECQAADWREHRKICMPLPRLLPRADVCQSVYQINRVNEMLMNAPTKVNGFDSTTSAVEYSKQTNSGKMTQQQITKLTTKIEKIQVEQTKEDKAVEPQLNVAGIIEVMSTPAVTPEKKQNNDIQTEKMSSTSTGHHKLNEKASSSVCTEQSATIKKTLTSFRLTPPAKKTKNFKPWVQQIQAKIHVILVNIKDHQTVFVVPSCETKQWEKLILRVEEYAPSARLLKKPPQNGFIVLAKPKSSESFARAWVQKVNTAKSVAKVEFLEYGCTDFVQFDEMKCLSEELVNAPRLVNKLSLKGVPDTVPYPDAMVKYLTKLQDHQAELIVQQLDLIEKSELTVHCSATLVTTDKFVSINEEIMRLTPAEVEKETEEHDLDEIPQSAQAQAEASSNCLDIEMIPLAGKNLTLLIIDNSLMSIGFFSAIKEKNASLLAKNDALINQQTYLFASGYSFFPRDGDMCLAQSGDGRWYRAFSQGKDDEYHYQLLYLDYGNMETVHSDRIREMREEFAFPCITSLCYIDGLDGKLTPRVVEYLQQLLQPCSEFTFDEVFNKDGDLYCKSDEILKILAEERLI